MFRHIVLALSIIFLATILIPRNTHQIPLEEEIAVKKRLEQNVREYLESKESPLALETEFLLTQEHWKFLIAISAIESQYCKRQLGNNCWGVTNTSGKYQKYNSFREGIKDTNDLIERWQGKGRWLTVNDFNCHYVVPCNDNWVSVVNQVIEKLDGLQQGEK